MYHHQRFGGQVPRGLVGVSWESCLIRCHVLQFWEICTFRSPDDVQASQGLVPSLSVSCESKSIFLGVWLHKGWLAVLDRGLSSKVEANSSGGIFSNRQNLQEVRCDA